MTFRPLRMERSTIWGPWQQGRTIAYLLIALLALNDRRTAGRGGIRRHPRRRNQGVRRDLGPPGALVSAATGFYYGTKR